MTTDMYKSAKRLRVLVNDPKHIIAPKSNIRTIDDVLTRISVNRVGPLLVGSGGTSSDQTSDQTSLKPSKRQKITINPKPNMISEDKILSEDKREVCDFRAFRVIYGVYKPNKKHKQFSSDGFITVGTNDLSVRLYSLDGKNISNPKLFKSWEQFESGNRLLVGSRELEIDEEVSALEFKNKKYFIENCD